MKSPNKRAYDYILICVSDQVFKYNWTEFCDSGDTVLNKTFVAPQDSKGSKVRNELQQFLSL